MKKVLLLFVLLPMISFSQEKITLNEITALYEYSHVKDFESKSQVDDFIKNMKTLKYTNIIVDDSSVTGENYFSVMIMSTPLQVHYYVYIDLKETKYKLTINKFVIEDKRWSPVPLENIKSGKDRWISKINENPPKIIKALESKTDW